MRDSAAGLLVPRGVQFSDSTRDSTLASTWRLNPMSFACLSTRSVTTGGSLTLASICMRLLTAGLSAASATEPNINAHTANPILVNIGHLLVCACPGSAVGQEPCEQAVLKLDDPRGSFEKCSENNCSTRNTACANRG